MNKDQHKAVVCKLAEFVVNVVEKGSLATPAEVAALPEVAKIILDYSSELE